MDIVSPAALLELDDDALLEAVARQTFRFFWEGAEPASRMARDRSTKAGDPPERSGRGRRQRLRHDGAGGGGGARLGQPRATPWHGSSRCSICWNGPNAITALFRISCMAKAAETIPFGRPGRRRRSGRNRFSDDGPHHGAAIFCGLTKRLSARITALFESGGMGLVPARRGCSLLALESQSRLGDEPCHSRLE